MDLGFEMNFCVVIPARYKSTRFPGKPLAKILGKSLIILVIENINKIINKDKIYVATDDERIFKEVTANGFKAIMTSEAALTGTDRLAEVVEIIDYEIYINVQGDEPLINPADIIECAKLKEKYPNRIINGYSFINENENPTSLNIPKTVISKENKLLYISRGLIPSTKKDDNKNIKYKKQVCIYGFSKNDLIKFNTYGSKSPLEELEDIEIIRFLEMNTHIHMFKCSGNSLAVDVPCDILKIEEELIKRNNDSKKIL